MEEVTDFLKTFKSEVEQWTEKPTVSAAPEVMYKILTAVEVTIELVNTNRKVFSNEKELFEGGPYLARYFDGWGETFFEKYLEMVKYVKSSHW